VEFRKKKREREREREREVMELTTLVYNFKNRYSMRE
jgi:hypothetical protein